TRLVEGAEDVVGLVPLGRVAVVQYAIDRLAVRGQQKVHDRQAGVVGHAEGVAVTAHVDRRRAEAVTADREAARRRRLGAVQGGVGGVDRQRRRQHLGV